MNPNSFRKSPNDIVQELRRKRRNKISITKARDYEQTHENNRIRRGGKIFGKKHQRNERNQILNVRHSDSNNSAIRKRRVRK